MIHGLALCAGVGMLDEGVRTAFALLGREYRTVCYVEREAFAASRLVGLMEAQCLDAAPVWNDLLTFDSRRWRGVVDCVTAGFPCQPHSVAGKRKGIEDERWIWTAIGGIIRDVSPRFVFLENVRGLLSSGGFESVLGSLAVMGFDVQWGMLSAASVGASHRRERVFILAHAISSSRQRRGVAGIVRAAQSEESGEAFKRQRDGHAADDCDGGVGNAEGNGRDEGRPESARIEGRPDAAIAVSIMGDTHSTHAQRGGYGNDETRRKDTHGHAGLAGGILFAPGQADRRWPAILAERPDLAPATEPGIRLLVDELACVVDESRSDQLRAIGNGVVPAQAAAAFVVLARRAGIV